MAIRISMIATNRETGNVEFRTALFDRPGCNAFMAAFMEPDRLKRDGRGYTVAVSYVDLDIHKFGTKSHTMTKERIKELIKIFNFDCEGIPSVNIYR